MKRNRQPESNAIPARFGALRALSALALALASAMFACASSTSVTAPPATASAAPGANAPTPWPPLPTDFVSGRVATRHDVVAGRALFSAETMNAAQAEPSSVPVPQYAYCWQEGQRIRAIVVQAEIAAGMELLGVRIVETGKGLITLFSSCELLGKSPPP
jgi:hypothetical protein